VEDALVKVYLREERKGKRMGTMPMDIMAV
jgi:hypothetical protein